MAKQKTPSKPGKGGAQVVEAKHQHVWMQKSPIHGYVIETTTVGEDEPKTRKFDSMWAAIHYSRT